MPHECGQCAAAEMFHRSSKTVHAAETTNQDRALGQRRRQAMDNESTISRPDSLASQGSRFSLLQQQQSVLRKLASVQGNWESENAALRAQLREVTAERDSDVRHASEEADRLRAAYKRNATTRLQLEKTVAQLRAELDDLKVRWHTL